MSVPRSHHNRPSRHLAAVGPDFFPPSSVFDDDFGSLPFESLRTTAEPLADEPFDWSGVDARDRAAVAAVLDRCDAGCTELLDVEFRTIARRILTMLATRGPRPLRRTTNHDRLAAGIVWLAGRGNGEFGRRAPRWRSARQIWDFFGATSCADRGYTIRNAAGLVPETIFPDRWLLDAVPLATTALLHSKTRRLLITDRDTRLRVERERRRWSLSPDGRSVAFRATRVSPLAVTRGQDAESDQSFVLVALGGPGVELDEADLYGLPLPDARRLFEMLRRALGPS